AYLGRHCQSEARFAAAARTGECDQAVAGQQIFYAGDFTLAADKTAQRQGQMIRTGVFLSGNHGRFDTLESSQSKYSISARLLQHQLQSGRGAGKITQRYRTSNSATYVNEKATIPASWLRRDIILNGSYLGYLRCSSQACRIFFNCPICSGT